MAADSPPLRRSATKVGATHEPIRFGVLGTGRITRRMIPELQSTAGDDFGPGTVVSAIASRDTGRARWYADQHGIASTSRDVKDLVRRDDVDAVYIATPPALHEEACLAAIESGKMLLCEKPLTHDAASTRRVSDAANRAGVRWLDATGWLHHRRTDAFRGWLGEGAFGTITHVSVAVSFYRPFNDDDHRLNSDLGGGCVLDLGWYAAGLISFVAGSVDDVDVRVVREGGIVVRLAAVGVGRDGVTVTASVGYDTAGRKWFEAAGTDASLICDDFTRPWPDRDARCWIHDRVGGVRSETFDGNQERAMIRRLIGDEPLEDLHRQCLRTAELVDRWR